MKLSYIFVFLMGCAEKSTDSAQPEPAVEPSEQPAAEPEASDPTSEPSAQPTSEPEGVEPSNEPEGTPTSEPTAEPTSEPTTEPSNEPETAPTTCTLNDLSWGAEMRSTNGAGTTFSSVDGLVLAGVVKNPCTDDFVLTTNTTCLIGQALIQGDSGATESTFLHQPFCGSALTDWVIEGGGSIEETASVGALPVDTYTLEISFGDSMTHSANGLFSVVP